MKSFKHILALFFCAGLLTQVAFAQEFTVSGTVVFGVTEEPFGGYPVYITEEGSDDIIAEAYSNNDGVYEVTLSPATDGLPYIVRVSTFDLCTGENFEAIEVVFTEDPQTVEGVNFHVCSEFDPPPPPEDCDAYFTYEPTANDVLTINFIDLSYSEVDFVTYAWDFGDGTTSTEQNPSHTYAEEGVYTVTLTIIAGDCESTIVQQVYVGDDPCGCDDEEYEIVCVEIGPGLVVPLSECIALCEGFTPDQFVDGPCGDIGGNCLAYFEFESDASDSLTINFTDISDGAGSDIVSWEWHFGDGTTSADQNPTYTYAEAGGYEVILTIETESGCVSTFHLTVFVGIDDDCNCDDVFDPVCVLFPDGFTFTFPNECEALCAGFGPDTWVECDNDCPCPDIYDPVCVLEPATGLILTFTNECYAICEGYGPDSFIDCQGNDGCFAFFELEYAPAVDSLTVYLTDLSETDDSPIISWTWEFGDGTTSSEQNPSHTYAEAGGYSIILTIETEDGCVSTFITYIVIGNIDDCNCPDIYDPVCVITPEGFEFEFPNECYALCAGFDESQFTACEFGGEECFAGFVMSPTDDPLTVTFEDLSQTFEGTITNWEWNFGDGNTSNEQNPTHTYAAEGIYEVSLTIETDSNCVATTYQHICIGEGGYYEGPDCQAVFYFEQNPDDLTEFNFIDISFGNIINWEWDFGDGNTSNEQNPTHTYAEDGSYLVTLTITTQNGDDPNDLCTSTISVFLFTDPSAWYDNECNALFIPFIFPETNEVFFINLSSTDAISFEWDFGDGTTSLEPLPSHQYEAEGEYEVTLTITTAEGCVSTYVVTLNVEDANFTGTPQYLTISNTTDSEAMLAPLNVTPNPAAQQAQVQFDAASAEMYQLQVLTLEGQAVIQERISAQTGTNLHDLDLGELPSGLYLIRLQSQQGIQTTKLIKQ